MARFKRRKRGRTFGKRGYGKRRIKLSSRRKRISRLTTARGGIRL